MTQGMNQGSIFASRTVPIHLLRGLGAAILIVVGFWLVSKPEAFGGAVLGEVFGVSAFVGAVFLMRGCPTCWMLGLLGTIAARTATVRTGRQRTGSTSDA